MEADCCRHQQLAGDAKCGLRTLKIRIREEGTKYFVERKVLPLSFFLYHQGAQCPKTYLKSSIFMYKHTVLFNLYPT
jgi:hypothetical protein